MDDGVRTTIYLPTAVAALGKRLAKADQRNFSNFIQRLILDAGESVGLKPTRVNGKGKK